MMDTYIKVILIAFLFNVAPGNADCDFNYDPGDKCYTIYITCKEHLTFPMITSRNILSYNKGIDGLRCSDISTTDHYGYTKHFHEINLKYVGTDVSFNHDYNYNLPIKIEELITTLELCDNVYQEMPRYIFELSNLKHLRISFNSLKTVSLSDLGQHTSITDLDISNNLIDTITNPLGHYENEKLNKLNLSHNYLVMIPDLVFQHYTLINNLDLSHNFIDVLNYLTFEGLQNLNCLNVSYNRLSELNKSLLNIREVFELDLSHNQLQVITESDFEKLTKLLKLNLSYNEIKNIEKLAFRNFQKLEEIDLSNNILEFLDKDLFINTTNLKTVNLNKNFLHQLSKDLFENKHLSSFSIKNNCLNGTLMTGMFEGLDSIKTIDLSNQYLTGVEDYAFLGLKDVDLILLSNNKISKLTFNSFRRLKSLRTLDLSNNTITIINFTKEDLTALQFLNLNSNQLSHIKMEQFMNLQQLLILDLSFNKIINIEPQSFKNLGNLSRLIISNNPLSSFLQKNTFDGLYSLKSLEISNTQLTILKNNTFHDLSLLTNLNVSHCKISEVQFNAFDDITNIENIDLSYNQLHHFSINSFNFTSLKELNLDGNFLTELESSIFNNIPFLQKLSLTNNNLTQFSVDSINRLTNLLTLTLSGIDGRTTCFNNTENMTLSKLVITQSNIGNVSILTLKNLQRIETLVLNYDNINNLSTADFSGMKNLNKLDLSFNNITYIQPGTFKDNGFLSILNISHNSLFNIGYGVFHGLTKIDTIDLSFNSLSILQSKHFQDIKSLRILIADHNHISDINIAEFEGKYLTLSVGDNPLPCEMLLKFLKNPLFGITSAYKDSTKENVRGITCNIHNHIPKNISTSTVTNRGENNEILKNIRNILVNISEKYDYAQMNHSETSPNIITNETIILINEIRNATLEYNNITNTFLNSFKKLFVQKNENNKWVTQTINKNNTTTFINRMNSVPKNESSFVEYLKDTLVQHQIDLEKQVKLLGSRFEKQSTSDSETLRKSNGGHLIFMDICLALILLILVCFTLYKIYDYKVYILNSRSISTRAITELEANSEL